MHKIIMVVSIPDENWETFRQSLKEIGEVQLEYRGSTIIAEKF